MVVERSKNPLNFFVIDLVPDAIRVVAPPGITAIIVRAFRSELANASVDIFERKTEIFLVID